MHILAGFLILIGIITVGHNIQEKPKNELQIEVGSEAPCTVRPDVEPLTEIQAQCVVKQNYDYSCGSAALATLLNYYLGENFTERQVIQGLMQYGDTDKIAKRRAFSLLDMKKFVNALGYKGAGYRANIDDLKGLDKPGIVPIKILTYRHFAVLKDIQGGHVFLADPWRGNISFTVPEFKERWYENVLFMVEPETGKGLSALELKESDLRFIDEDSAREFIFGQADFVTPERRKLDSLSGTSYQFYKR